MKTKNTGFSLIELLIGLAVLSVLGIMIMLLVGMAVRLYHSSVGTSAVHGDSYRVGQIMTRAVMEADSIYLNEEDEGIVLFTGRITPDDESILYEGELFWWDEFSGCLYHGSYVTVRAQREENRGTLTGSAAEACFLDSPDDGTEYLLSNKVVSLSMELFPSLNYEDLAVKDDNFYIVDSAVTVNFSMTFSYLDSGEYKTNLSASTRNRINYLWISEPVPYRE